MIIVPPRAIGVGVIESWTVRLTPQAEAEMQTRQSTTRHAPCNRTLGFITTQVSALVGSQRGGDVSRKRRLGPAET